MSAVIADALTRFPDTYALLFRRYGMLGWGESWQSCKAPVESLENLFETYVKVRCQGGVVCLWTRRQKDRRRRLVRRRGNLE